VPTKKDENQPPWWRVAAKDVIMFITLFSLSVAMLGGPLHRLRDWVVLDLWGYTVAVEGGGVCVSIPSNGHAASRLRQGARANITWRNIHRHRDDCGIPVVTGWIANGNGVLHQVELSIEGVALPLGITPRLTYQFWMAEGDVLECGPGELQVIVSFPDAVGGAPPEISPWVPVQIC